MKYSNERRIRMDLRFKELFRFFLRSIGAFTLAVGVWYLVACFIYFTLITVLG